MINLGSHQLPINAATKTFAILAKRGAGKSYTGAVFAEEFFKNNIPFVVFDPIDVWWGLRFDKDGKSKGLPIVVFGLDHADIQIDRGMGKQIAQALIKYNISCVISTFGMPKVAQRQLITEFSEELLRSNNTPRHVFIEEAHEFVPQRVFGELGKTFNAVSNLVVMGRNRGIGVTLINQRAATLNKDVLTQVDTLLAFRNIAPQDRSALREWVQFHAAEGDFEKFMQSLPSLPTGQGWIWSPEFLGIFERIKIRARQTFHPDREKMGENFEMPDLEQLDVQSFIDEFKRMQPEKKGEKAEQTKAVVGSTGSGSTAAADLIALRNEYESKLTLKDTEIGRLSMEITRLSNQLQQIRGLLDSPGSVPAPRMAGNTNVVDLWLGKLKREGEKKILRFLGENAPRGFTRQQITVATGQKYSTVKTYVQTLKRLLLLKEEGETLFLNADV